MDPLKIWIYQRQAPHGHAEKYCQATLLEEREPYITFETNTFISPGLGLSYHVRTSASVQADEQEEFRELEIYPNAGRGKTLTYTVKLGPKWKGTVVEKDDKGEDTSEA